MKKELIKNMVSLIVGEAFLEFIENPTSANIVNDLRDKYSEKILSAIDSMQEEPVSEPQVEESAKTQHAKETCKENDDSLTQEPVSEENLSNVERIVKNWKEEPVSECLEQAIDTYLATYFGGEKEKQDWPFLKKMAIHFANLQKEQIIKKLCHHANIDQMVEKFEDKYNPKNVLDTEYYKRGIFDTLKLLRRNDLWRNTN
jgi:hypothetical protein